MIKKQQQQRKQKPEGSSIPILSSLSLKTFPPSFDFALQGMRDHTTGLEPVKYEEFAFLSGFFASPSSFNSQLKIWHWVRVKVLMAMIREDQVGSKRGCLGDVVGGDWTMVV